MRDGAIIVSFDAVAVSGITVEALKVAKDLQMDGIRCYLDMGYDIKLDKGNLNRPYGREADIYRNIFTLVRIADIDSVPDYTDSFIKRSHDILIRQTTPATEAEKNQLLKRIHDSSVVLAVKIIDLWEKLGIGYVIIENGTLPENIIYTKGLYLAVDLYGEKYGLEKYVVWRDHDLMWSSEQSAMKYGPEPFAYAVKPVPSRHINYVTLNNTLKEKLEAWCEHRIQVHVRKNTYEFGKSGTRTNVRASLGISTNDVLIARTTRIIPQKRLDRDIHLIAALNTRFAQRGIHRKAYLVIAGDPEENSAYFSQLVDLATSLQIESLVRYIGSIPHEDVQAPNQPFTIQDLYHSCDLVSFLTSWGYDSYGNPIGEAISAGRCYITTTYEFYHEVYGQYGFRAPSLSISEDEDGPIDELFIEAVYCLICDRSLIEETSCHNFELGKQVLSNNISNLLIPRPTGVAMLDQTFVSVVLPVYNESARIDSVLSSLFNQQSKNNLITHATFEIIIVDNNSTDDSVAKAQALKAKNPSFTIHIVTEATQGVSSARKRGMDYAAHRARQRDARNGTIQKHYIASADADCTVDTFWLHELIETMMVNDADLGTCNYYYDPAAFHNRPNLFREIQKTLRCREMSFSLFGGFPDGKGFAVERSIYDKVGGIEIFYQVRNGRFVEHLSDDWDFGIRVIAHGGKPIYAHGSRVEINSRRVDTLLEEVITGNGYGINGVITMKDVRPDCHLSAGYLRDTTSAQSLQAWYYSIKDYIPKNLVLPVLLNPHLLTEKPEVRGFFTPYVADRLYQRIDEIKRESGIVDLIPIHAYKTPAYRLYFEFRKELFGALRRAVGDDIGFPPPLPECLDTVNERDFERFVRYFSEDRESGEAHNYFANGGVF
jgi:glycosyltransferase involved in cell wall biosynthesis